MKPRVRMIPESLIGPTFKFNAFVYKPRVLPVRNLIADTEWYYTVRDNCQESLCRGVGVILKYRDLAASA